MLIGIKDLHRVYEVGSEKVHALNGVSLDIEPNEYVAIMGPSGSGKSTLMNLVGCLDTPTSGSYRLKDHEIGTMSDDELARIRNQEIGFVFQTFNLLPRSNALHNVELPLIYGGMKSDERRKTALDALAQVGLADRVHHKPNELSGGQRQRVAMGRAIVRDPKVFLFDEPLSNLDAKLRVAMRAEIKQLHQRLETTTVYVTHDQIEAMTMADRIVVMHDGIIEQIGTPLELFDRPSNLFVAQFIGSPAMNVFEGSARDGVIEGLGANWPVPPGISASPGQRVQYAVRPTDLQLAGSGIAGKVVVVEPTGAETELLVDVGGRQLTVVTHGRVGAGPGDEVHLLPDAARVHVFDGKSGQRLQ